MARDDAGQRGKGGDEVRDLEERGDLGAAGHSAFGAERHQGHRHNDERLAGRGRNPGREDGAFLDEEGQDAARDPSGAPGTVRGLTPPDKDDVGA